MGTEMVSRVLPRGRREMGNRYGFPRAAERGRREMCYRDGFPRVSNRDGSS